MEMRLKLRILLQVCLNSDENVLLSIVFIYNPTDAQRIHDGDIFTEQKQLLQHYEVRLQKLNSYILMYFTYI